MNTLEVIASRRSYRGKYLSDPVPEEHLRQILEAGYHAPSGCNKQTTSFLAVNDPGVLKKLHGVIDPPIGETAPAMICVLTQKIIAYRDRSFYIQDYSAAIQNMLLAIADLGYASCWIEGHITDTDRIGDQMARILGVPDDYEMVCFLPVGIPAEEIKPIRKKPFDSRVWLNGFGNSL
ncbi:MAG: nitroreductase family protein [Oscillospiraceae bacterium]|nr:nitroreductase family protein [Oscillospiraceae bacterium]